MRKNLNYYDIIAILITGKAIKYKSVPFSKLLNAFDYISVNFGKVKIINVYSRRTQKQTHFITSNRQIRNY